MRVLKVVAEGVTTSFRYPHFMQKIHPTFPMPPPATIYGHICSALGEWFDPKGVSFAYHFTHAGEVWDTEHIIILSRATGKLQTTQLPKVLEGGVNPFERQILFQPRLTLYINRPEWEDAFRSPCFAVALGRSQDLFCYTSVSIIEVEQAERAYFEHTLVPHEMALQLGRGITMTMPRFLDYENNRRPTFDQYLVVQERVTLPNDDLPRFAHLQYGPYWVDPTAPVSKEGIQRGLAFLNFTEDPP
jgi:CRISPR-associated protein Cas5t